MAVINVEGLVATFRLFTSANGTSISLLEHHCVPVGFGDTELETKVLFRTVRLRAGLAPFVMIAVVRFWELVKWFSFTAVFACPVYKKNGLQTYNSLQPEI